MESLYSKILNKSEKIAVVGMGYVGMPIAVAFSRKANVIGFDINVEKINLFKSGIDPTNEIGSDIIKKCSVEFTSEENKLKEAKFFIIAVPTPVFQDHTPDLTPIESASVVVGKNIQKGSIVVYESTVYPGVTEKICVPILEKYSNLKCGEDFKIGYSPERINPGDKIHRLDTIVKIVSGMDVSSLTDIAQIYSMVVEAGVYKASSIKVAEAAKVIENSQRDINIAFMNEISIIFSKMGIDTLSVLDAASTKWNFLKFYPGLVGGHCIGVDPYYLTYRAEQLGYHSQIILAARKINDDMGKYVAENTVKQMIKSNILINNSKVAIFGVTFKENVPDIRNSKVIDIYNELIEYGVRVTVVDPVADQMELQKKHGIHITDMNEVENMDAVIFAVSHDKFMKLDISDISKYYRNDININKISHQNENNKRVVIDIRGILDKNNLIELGYRYWRL